MSFSTIYLAITIMLCGQSNYEGRPNEDAYFLELLQSFKTEWNDLRVVRPSMFYIARIQSIQTIEGLNKQARVLDKADSLSKTVLKDKLSEKALLSYHQWQYEIKLNRERLFLERKIKESGADFAIGQNPAQKELRKQWYLYLVKEYAGCDVSLEKLNAFGLSEIRKVQDEIRKLQERTGFSANTDSFYNFLQQMSFVLSDEKEIQNLYRKKYETILSKLPELFQVNTNIPLNIKNSPTNNADTPPGYYIAEENTFYYNFFDQQHNSRSMDFLLLHEGVPGHHLQFQLNQSSKSVFSLSDLFLYRAYSEGWAAYCEGLGHQLGLYNTEWDYMGKLEWDIVRATRIVMDIGLNFNDWTDQQALDFWRQNIQGQEAIALREIKRMRSSPAQVHTYLVGAYLIRQLIDQEKKKKGDQFNLGTFHSKFLKQGPLPFSVLLDSCSF
ncbi:MAG TPA: DUF885 domain-containing protein [Segetibacter sp.]|jgi:uncharacterized protein (DUF885 family)